MKSKFNRYCKNRNVLGPEISPIVSKDILFIFLTIGLVEISTVSNPMFLRFSILLL